MKDTLRELLRAIPPMERFLETPWAEEASLGLGRDSIKSIVSDVIGEYRNALRKGEGTVLSVEDLEAEMRRRCLEKCAPSLRPVVNATGVVVHTNLGRSCLHDEAIEALTAVARSYSTLEYNLDGGKRGHRDSHVEWLLCQLTGADAALVVNNNAAAVLLCLAALAKDREVVVSRGELVEIGGSFRIPDIMAFSGAKMREVGTTNRTHFRDYAEAVSEATRMLLKVHPSNYRIVGFSAEVGREELATLAREKKLVFLEDLGSGVLVDLSPFGLSGEPTVRHCIAEGVDLVTFSGDKLLGGPQIGAVVGRKQLVDELRRYPLARALRVDKMTLAALEATLRLYLTDRWREIPSLAMLCVDGDILRERAECLAARLGEAIPAASCRVLSVEDAVGGGAFPARGIDGFAVAVSLPGWSAAALQARLRLCVYPVVANVQNELVCLHLRTLSGEDEECLLAAFREITGGGEP
ncbi:L-seryl-tRNA(Sec) selenium transferase [Aminiphilus circumscriptus]|uniref:L-seryl-tRNA(Sec) selenium transferase n=1 Tax=Aminiphilus circumscriptus TaxID=290732 RepID=UPI00049279E2|nr:L-seryl-tRNA(Sec) selenium transferase [Aminiphilus circumscriptus]